MLDNQMEEIYIKYHRELYLYAYALCKNHHLAQDLASDTFLKAYLSLQEGAYIKYWLFRVCKNLYLDYIKGNREYKDEDRIEKTLSDFRTPLDEMLESEGNKRLYHLIMNLNDSYKEMLILYYFCGFSIKEISQSKNMTEGAAKTMLFRARKKLKKEMEVQDEL